MSLSGPPHAMHPWVDGYDFFTVGVMLFRRDGTVAFVNRYAASLLARRDGMALQGVVASGTARLTLAQDGVARALARALDADRRGEKDHWFSAASRESSGSPYRLSLFHLPSARGRKDANAASAILFVFDPDAPPQVPLPLLRAMFGLSAAECRVAVLAMEAVSIGTIARRLDVSVNTAKTHLQSVYAKVGVRSRYGLIRLLVGLSIGVGAMPDGAADRA